jgi:hypothetical protein
MNRIDSLLAASQGFFDLGLFHEAWMELDNLEPKIRALPEVLLLRVAFWSPFTNGRMLSL